MVLIHKYTNYNIRNYNIFQIINRQQQMKSLILLLLLTLVYKTNSIDIQEPVKGWIDPDSDLGGCGAKCTYNYRATLTWSADQIVTTNPFVAIDDPVEVQEFLDITNAQLLYLYNITVEYLIDQFGVTFVDASFNNNTFVTTIPGIGTINLYLLVTNLSLVCESGAVDLNKKCCPQLIELYFQFTPDVNFTYGGLYGDYLAFRNISNIPIDGETLEVGYYYITLKKGSHSRYIKKKTLFESKYPSFTNNLGFTTSEYTLIDKQWGPGFAVEKKKIITGATTYLVQIESVWLFPLFNDPYDFS